MKNKISILLLLLCINLNLFGQEKDFYSTDNSYHELYRKAKVKSLKVYTSEYTNGSITEKYLELVQHLDKNGDILKEQEYLSSDNTDGWEVKYTYNNKHQTIKEEWTWLEDNEQELTEFTYNTNGKLSKRCNYIKSFGSADYILDKCEVIIYEKNNIQRVISNDSILQNYYVNENGIVSKIDANHKLKAKYKNGEMFYLFSDSIHYNYEKNTIGQLTKTTSTNTKNKTKSQTYFEYTDGLLQKVIYKDGLGNITCIEKYVYEYFE